MTTERTAAMTPREVLAEWLADHRMTPSHADGIIEALDANGLFIGPKVPTEDMLVAANAHPVTKAVDGLIQIASIHGAIMPAKFHPPNTPLRCWWEAMVAAMRRP